MIVVDIIFILLGVITFVTGSLKGKVSTTLLGMFCVVIWTFILFRDMDHNKEKPNNQITYKMVVKSEFYVTDYKNDTTLFKSDTIYKKL